ncbi:hypothetical protein C1701_15045 [Actinoalloteichus sp. AHMU CJ021]|uniref:CPCC family cysteine-rich protein n=1 Tax=Actinoalloteichus sp. AHMU CJ021 TaxID=2072503 RepID=UPI000CA05A29|nr:hypothetical protein C1701_15045 [Actinoalloteichus sp. AHMU CJ021]
MNLYPCPCCGYLVHNFPPGSHCICPICDWEDDLVQLRWPDISGANQVPLTESQLIYKDIGIADSNSTSKIRPLADFWSIDFGFRTIDEKIHNFEPNGAIEANWPEDRTRLYWWRPNFWRRLHKSP